jgi:hypothetical protein
MVAEYFARSKVMTTNCAETLFGGYEKEIKVSFEQRLEPDKRTLVSLKVERRGVSLCTDFLVDLTTCGVSTAEKVRSFFERYQHHQTTSLENLSMGAWLLDLSLTQDGMPFQGRQIEISKLLLLDMSHLGTQLAWEPPELLTPKQAIFEQLGQEYLISTGSAVLFEASKRLPHYPAIQRSYVQAAETLTFGLLELPGTSPALRRELGLFWLELRYHDTSATLRKYDPLIQCCSTDQRFCDILADTLKNRAKESRAKQSLDFYVVQCWIHHFFWGLLNADRIDLLHRDYRVSPAISERTIRRPIKELGLKDWFDFRQTYPEAPFGVTHFRPGEHGGEHGAYQIFIKRPDKFNF